LSGNRNVHARWLEKQKKLEHEHGTF
jgi:hypothetical protein